MTIERLKPGEHLIWEDVELEIESSDTKVVGYAEDLWAKGITLGTDSSQCSIVLPQGASNLMRPVHALMLGGQHGHHVYLTLFEVCHSATLQSQHNATTQRNATLNNTITLGDKFAQRRGWQI